MLTRREAAKRGGFSEDDDFPAGNDHTGVGEGIAYGSIVLVLAAYDSARAAYNKFFGRWAAAQKTERRATDGEGANYKQRLFGLL